MSGLNGLDHHAIVLRFFDNRSMKEVALALGTSEDAARKRVNRAVEKLRLFFTRRGMTVSSMALMAAVSAHSVQPAPAGLAAAISAAASVSGTAAAAANFTKTILMTTLQKAAMGAALAAAVGTALYQSGRASQFRRQVQSMESQNAELQITAQRDRADVDGQTAALRAEKAQARDLAALRAEAARLRASQMEARATPAPAAAATAPAVSAEPQPGGTELPRDSWADAGFATPEDALRTRGWAVLNGDRERFKESLFIRPEARKALEDMVVQMAAASNDPEKAKIIQQIVDNKYGVEEAILLPMMARSENLTGYRIVSRQTPSPSEAVLQVETELGLRPPEQQSLKLRQIGGDWKVVIDDGFVKSAH
jgi:hypothetical protein